MGIEKWDKQSIIGALLLALLAFLVFLGGQKRQEGEVRLLSPLPVFALAIETPTPSPTPPAVSPIEQIIREEFEFLGERQVQNALKVASCESGLDPDAVNSNRDGSKDRGVFQWNSRAHPYLTDAFAHDARISARVAAVTVLKHGWGAWRYSRTCHGVR